MRLYPTTMSRQPLGTLTCDIRTKDGYKPIDNAKIQIKKTGLNAKTIETLTTDNNGQTEKVELVAPPVELSLEPTDKKPYAEYTLEITSPDFETVVLEGSQIFSTSDAIQEVVMEEKKTLRRQMQVIPIAKHTLYGEFPPKIPEPEIKPAAEIGTGIIILDQVVVPEIIVVHDGVPDDLTATNYYIPFKQYIKNVASSEIYSTWPESTIIANTLAILSFTLNRIFTEWYRGKGKVFTITSSTAYDHKWTRGRNIFENISQVVDTIFTNFLSRPGIKQPIFTQYCDGAKVQCPKWMT